MERKHFLRGIGLVGAASLIPFGKKLMSEEKAVTGACTLIPSETTGPYPLDLSNDTTKFRSDIRESQVGAETRVKLRIISTTDCNPIQNARVDIWHCNAYGYYSGYTTNGQNGSINYAGATWLRGIQMTDANGEVEFTTVFPGWYSGRVTHIHFQVYLSSMLQVTSQLTFPVAAKNALYAANAPYATYGDDPASLSSDNVFSDGYAVQMATLTQDTTSGVYLVEMPVAINAASNVTGLLKMEPETGGQFKLKQNYPNPYTTETEIPFTLANASDVKLELFDLSGKRVAVINKRDMPSGEGIIRIIPVNLGISSSNYLYQLEVKNSNGTFRQCKMMTAAK